MGTAGHTGAADPFLAGAPWRSEPRGLGADPSPGCRARSSYGRRTTRLPAVGRRAVLIVMVVVALLLPAIGVVAQPDGTGGQPVERKVMRALDFDGKGWGHGLGMSQWGAYAMALKGKSYRVILGHYYAASKTRKLGTGRRDATSPIVVNLEQDFTSKKLRVDAISGEGKPVVITRGDDEWSAPPGSTITIRGSSTCALTITGPSGKKTEISSGPCNFDFSWYRWNRAGAKPKTAVAVIGCTNTDWNVIPSVSRGCRYAHGKLHLRSGPGGLDLSVRLRLEDYLLGISEMPYHWGSGKGMAALRAQAVAARSYARELQLTRGKLSTNVCDAFCHVRDTTWDQRYVGYGHLQANWAEAVSSTADVVVTHPKAPQQGIVRAYYSSSTGGRTESIQDVRVSPPVPYYKSVNDVWAVDGSVPNPNASWRASVAVADVEKATGLDEVGSVKVKARTAGGSAKTVEFSGYKDGKPATVERSGAWVRSTFGLKSAYFTLKARVTDRPCVSVKKGEGWASVTVRLGLPASQYPKVRAANPYAVTATGYLIIGAVVCAP